MAPYVSNPTVRPTLITSPLSEYPSTVAPVLAFSSNWPLCSSSAASCPAPGSSKTATPGPSPTLTDLPATRDHATDPILRSIPLTTFPSALRTSATRASTSANSSPSPARYTTLPEDVSSSCSRLSGPSATTYRPEPCGSLRCSQPRPPSVVCRSYPSRCQSTRSFAGLRASTPYVQCPSRYSTLVTRTWSPASTTRVVWESW